MDLKDTTVLITGAKGGLGGYVTTAFLEAGATVVGTSRSIRQTDFDHERFIAMPAEPADTAGASALVAEVQDRTNGIDALVHLVGGFAGGSTAEQEEEAAFQRMLDLNFHSALRFVRAVLPEMQRRRSGRILAVGSRAAVEPSPGLSAYSASKAALMALVRTVATENREYGITSNMVLPGTMDTPANRAANPGADFSLWVDPRQVASLLVFLASGQAAHINGAVIPMYGREA